MSATLISAIAGVCTIILSVFASTFISGARWGRLEATLRDLQQDRVRRRDLDAVTERLSRIEKMFTLRLRRDNRQGD